MLDQHARRTTGIVVTAERPEGVSADYFLMELETVARMVSDYLQAHDRRPARSQREAILPGHPLHHAVDVLQRHYSTRNRLRNPGCKYWRDMLRGSRSVEYGVSFPAADFLKWLYGQIECRRNGTLRSILESSLRMSYPKDLDEYSEKELVAELNRRFVARSRGVCDYCGRPPEAPACKFPERHALPLRWRGAVDALVK